MAALDDLVRVRSGLALAVLAVLKHEADQAALLPAYFPPRLRTGKGEDQSGFDALRQRVRVSGREALERWRVSQATARADSPAAWPTGAQRPRADRIGLVDRDEAPETLIWDDRAAAHFTRAIVLGEPGAGKSWLLRYEAGRLARDAWAKLNAQSVSVDEILLPIRLHLSEFAAPRYPSPTSFEEALVERVCDHAAEHMSIAGGERIGVPVGFESWVRSRFENGRCAVLLDAWDEVREAQDDLRKLIEPFAARYRDVRLLVTSRDAGYEPTRTPLLGAEVLTLVKLDDPAVDGFCRAWFQGDSSPAPQTEAPALAILQSALVDHVSLRDLARNPLMLTLMCRVFEDRPSPLPTHRAELYDACVQGLLWDWKTADSKTRTMELLTGSGQAPAAAIDGSSYARGMFDVLVDVARRLFTKEQPYRQDQVARMIETCQDSFKTSHLFAPSRVSSAAVFHACKTDGLLVATSGRRDADVALLHQTVHEYLVGVAMARPAVLMVADEQPMDEAARQLEATLAASARDPNWREVVLLALGYVGLVQKYTVTAEGPALAGAAIERVIQPAPDRGGDVVELMGTAVAEVLPRGVPAGTVTKVRKALIGTMENHDVPAKMRAACGDVLARVGDPRFHGEELWCLPNEPLLGFVEIPGGPFMMGSDKRSDPDAFPDEMVDGCQHPVELPTFYITRYPVTVAQFRAFVEDVEGNEGFEPGDPDCMRRIGNHPVVWVSWDEALRYCAWLTRTLRAWRETPTALADVLRPKSSPWSVTLPSEAEWEKAARGDDGRIYPWGNDNTRIPNHASYRKTDIRDTSAVGCFPGGASRFTVEELAGNVWEWTRSQYRPYPYEPNDDREDMGSRDRRVVRGGSFDSNHKFVRAAYRAFNEPEDRYDNFGFRVVLSPFRS